MSVKPILFNGEMVRAILDGRKTQTRRIAKFSGNPLWSGYVADGLAIYGSNNIPASKSPFKPGDILYVRETWGLQTRHGGCFTAYRADGETHNLDVGPLGSFATSPIKWHPSIHMPKYAARIFLRVKHVRAERLKYITFEDCKAEGIWDDYKTYSDEYYDALARRAYPIRFAELWDSTIKKINLETCGWQANPWVWVIEFERCEKPEGWLEA